VVDPEDGGDDVVVPAFEEVPRSSARDGLEDGAAFGGGGEDDDAGGGGAAS
jgi:hypothetical protein